MDPLDVDRIASDDEQVILSQTQEFCRLLGVSPFKFNPYRVDWQEYVAHYKAVVPVIMADECCIDPSLVTLQRDLKGSLRPSEWKPLIACSLLYAFRNKRRLRRDVLVKVVAPVAAISIGLGVILGAVAFYYLTNLLVAFLVVPLGLTVVAYFASLPRILTMTRKTRLESDREAARIFGREELLESLKKVDALHLSSIERLERSSTSRFLFKPTIKQRIDSLSSVD